MAETFAALLLAHVLADFVVQTGWIAARKQDRHAGAFALHIASVLALSVAALGVWHPLLLALAGAHFLTDLGKTFLPRDRPWPFLVDQGLHLAALAAVALVLPDLWQAGIWAGMDGLPGVFALVAGLVVTTRAGGFAVGLLMARFPPESRPEGLPQGGVWIGLLERGLIYLLVLPDQAAGIGFLIAAKSVLRFETTARDRHAGEYVIVGTLASFGWAMSAAWATRALLSALPPIGIPVAIP